MKEDESNWFSKWESQLPKPEELIPINQTLITPDLALAFDINNTHNPYNNNINNYNNNINILHHQQQQQPPSVSTPSSQPNNSGEFDSSELGADEPARTLKRPRLVWTPQLHKRFVDAVSQLGIKHAVPKTIMQLMSVDGLTRENVASHLQKYRLYLKRMQSLGSGGSGGGGFGSGGDPVTDRLFASSPVPPHFLHQSAAAHPGSDGFLPYMPAAVLQQQHQQMAVAGHHHFQRHFGSPVLSRQPGQGVHMVGTPVRGSYVDDSQPVQEKKALTLFPIGDE